MRLEGEVGAAITGTAAVLFAAVGVWRGYGVTRLTRSGARASATIVAISDATDGRFPVVQFTSPSGETHAVILASGGLPGEVGDTLVIVYPPDRPEQAVTVDRFHRWLVPAGCLVTAAIFAWAAVRLLAGH